MSRDQLTSETDERQRIHEMLASRRKFLEAVGAAGVLAGVGGITVAQEGTETYEFGGEVQGWQARSPSEIEGEQNPTLELEAGTEYEVVWENLDGQPHDFVIQDDQGEYLAGTEIHSEQGETYSFTFTATEAMAQYICTVHPTTMVGDIQVGGGGGEGEPTDQGNQFGGYVSEGPTVGVEQVAAGPLVNPVGLHSIPGQQGRHLVVDQPGQIYVHDAEDGLDEEPVFDIGDRLPVLEETDGDYERGEGFDERGLLGLAFHPEFGDNDQVYLRYSSRDPVQGDQDSLVGPGDREMPEDFDHVEVLSEFQVTGVGADTAEDDTAQTDGQAVSIDEGSERVLLEIPSPQFNHNAGDLAFGPDEYLYVPMGDGGGANDTHPGHVDDWYDENAGGNGQNVEENLLGSVLRLDVDQEGEDTPYAIPDDNPLVDTEGFDEIFAYGLRNPWRVSFVDDQLVAADVGQALFEEVDVIEAGGNYGWNVKEGFHCFDADNPTTPPEDCPDAEPDEAPYDGSEFVDPVMEYPHRYQGSQVGISITGGYVYEGDQIDDLDGRYVFGDWSANFAEPQGRIFVATPDDGDDGGDGGATTGDAENGTSMDGNGTAMDGDGNETDETELENVTVGQEGGENETVAAGNATEGNETSDGEGEQPSIEDAVDLQTPDEQPWQWEEVMIEGGQDQRLNRFIQSFARDADGELYALASQTGRLESPNGEIYRLVPSGEGEDVPEPDAEISQGEDESEDDAAATDNGTNANQTAADNETVADNETAE